MSLPSQPYDVYPDLASPGLEAAWLGKTVAHKNLGVDAGPGAYDLTPVNPTDMIAREVGCEFLGTNGYLRRPVADWRSGDSFGSITAWIRRLSYNTFDVIWSTADEASVIFEMQLMIPSTDVIRFQWRSGAVVNQIDGTSTITDDGWHFLGATSDGNIYRLYLDGTEETVSVSAGANDGKWLSDIGAGRDNVIIGATLNSGGLGSPFHGEIKDVRYYSRTLT